MSEATPEALRAMLFAAVKRQSTERYNALLAAAQKAPVPWDAAIIKGIAFQVSPKDFEIYSVHPGFDLQERLEAVATARKDFHRSVDDLLRTRDELAEADAGRKLHDKATAARFDHIEAQAQKKMSSAAADAVTLAYYSKRLKRRVAGT